MNDLKSLVIGNFPGREGLAGKLPGTPFAGIGDTALSNCFPNKPHLALYFSTA
jgi:hypothetical protein